MQTTSDTITEGKNIGRSNATTPQQQAQLARGGCYIFAERVAEAIDELVRYRDEVLARIG